MAKNNGPKDPNRPYDLSPTSANMRGSLHLTPYVISLISDDMKQQVTEWQRTHPQPMSDQARIAMYETVAAAHGATPEQARLIAFRSNGPRQRPQDYTLKTSTAEHPVWKELAMLHGVTVKKVVSLALATFCQRLGLDLHNLCAEEGGLPV